MLQPLNNLGPIDYLIVGHIARDITPHGPVLGGTATYASLTAKALGLRAGVVTAWGAELPLGPLRDIPIASMPAEASTTFENIYTAEGRIQYVHSIAPALGVNLIPDPWRKPAIIHLGPLVQEVEPGLVRNFQDSFIGVTPQGWLRSWDKQGRITPSEWPEATFVLQRVNAAVISVEDVGYDESRIEEMAASCRVLAVTEAHQGSRVYWNGDVRRFRPPKVTEVDATGAGDIFAATFFYRLLTTRDPWEAARFATQISAISVTRSGLESIPTAAEVEEALVEVYK